MHDDPEYQSYRNYLQHLIDMEHLDDAALGVTRQVLADGEDSLTDNQKHVFKKYVLDEYTVSNCKLCSNTIPWEEMYEAVTEDGMCSYCRKMSLNED